MPPTNTQRTLITPAEAARLSGQTTQEVNRLIYKGALKMHRVNGRFFVDRDELMALPFSQGGMGAETHQDEQEESEFTVLEPVVKPTEQLAGLTRHIGKQIDAIQLRKRKRKKKDEAYFSASLLSFVDAIAMIALVRIQPHGGLNVAYSDSKYTGSDVSSTQLLAIRKAMEELGLIEVGGHFFDSTGKKRSYATRIRPTPAFKALVKQYGVELPPLPMPTPSYAISEAAEGVGEAPDSIVAQDAIVRRYNEYTRQFELTLPDNAWAELEAYMIEADSTGKTTKLHKGFDDRRIYLIRLFKGNWNRSGRMYHGHWQGMPKAFRSQLLIDGKPTVELDYSRLHPRMLYNREGHELEDGLDPYTVPGFNVPIGAAKETFNRLLNSKKNIAWRAKEDKAHFKTKEAFNAYRDAMIAHLQPIAHNFQSDEGAKLQKIDSDLALKVMDRCMDEGIAVYPVHDSFIVTEDNAEALRTIMLEEYEKMMGFSAEVK